MVYCMSLTSMQQTARRAVSGDTAYNPHCSGQAGVRIRVYLRSSAVTKSYAVHEGHSEPSRSQERANWVRAC